MAIAGGSNAAEPWMAREHLSAYSSLVHHPEEQAMTEVVTADAGLLSFVRGPGEGSPLNVLGSPYVVKASAAETGDAFCCIECTIPPGAGVPPHTHTREHEAFYVLAGEIVVSSVDVRAPTRLGVGAFFFTPRGRQHTFRNESRETARILVICTPGAGMEAMFTAFNAAGRNSGGPPQPAEIGAIAAQAGVVFGG
jgi:quercetin dioxygenase-like cupin family protein